MEMRHALTLALQNFNGALVVVSHDRHLIRCTTDELILINNGRCETFEGDIDNYSLYLDKDSDKYDDSVQSGFLTDEASTFNSSASKKDKKRLEAEQRAKVSPLRKELAKIEKQIDKLSEEKQNLEEELSDSEIYTDQNKEKLKDLLMRQSEVNNQLAECEEKWLDLSDAIEEVLKE